MKKTNGELQNKLAIKDGRRAFVLSGTAGGISASLLAGCGEGGVDEALKSTSNFKEKAVTLISKFKEVSGVTGGTILLNTAPNQISGSLVWGSSGNVPSLIRTNSGLSRPTQATYLSRACIDTGSSVNALEVEINAALTGGGIVYLYCNGASPVSYPYGNGKSYVVSRTAGGLGLFVNEINGTLTNLASTYNITSNTYPQKIRLSTVEPGYVQVLINGVLEINHPITNGIFGQNCGLVVENSPVKITRVEGFVGSVIAPIQKTDLTYLGSARVPTTNSGNATFDYSGYSISAGVALSSDRLGLFVVGKRNTANPQAGGQLIAELLLPNQFNNSGVLSNLPLMTFRQGFTDPLEGKLPLVEASGTAVERQIRGLYADGSDLLISAWAGWTTGADSTSAGHFKRPSNLAVSGQVVGPKRVKPSVPYRFATGYYLGIPASVQASHQLPPVAVGNCGGSIWQTLPAGPTLYAFNPTDLTGGSTVAATTLLEYSGGNGVTGSGSEFPGRHLPARFGQLVNAAMTLDIPANDYFNGNTHITGAVWIENRSVLFFGSHGIGDSWYGSRTGYQNGTGVQLPLGPSATRPKLTVPDQTVEIDQGNHAPPYRHQVWAYTQAEILSVKVGTKQPWEAVPYAVWGFSTPFTDSLGPNWLIGTAHDPILKRIYVVTYKQDASFPLVHAYGYV
jgi:hypothetical protein